MIFVMVNIDLIIIIVKVTTYLVKHIASINERKLD